MPKMNPGMKMMMLNRAAKTEDKYRSEYGGSTDRRMIGYDRDYNTENRRQYAEGNRMAYDMEEPESRRRRDSRGRYMLADMEEDAALEMRSAQTWYPPTGGMPYMPATNHMPAVTVPPATVYPASIPQMTATMPGNSYGDIYAHGSIYAPAAMNKPMMGEMNQPVDEQTARMWVMKMEGGEHFKMDQAEQQRMAICPNCEKWEFYVAMNAMYSDHCESAKKLGIDRPDYYAHLAKDFLKDKDAKPNKLRRYMETIPK